MATWRSIADKRGKYRKMFAIWIHEKLIEQERLRAWDKERLDRHEITPEEYDDLIKKEHADAFTLRELMEAHEMDYEARSDYTRAYSALAEERKDIEEYFKMFLNSGALEEARKQGKIDNDIWTDFITAANSWNIHLLYSDADGRYKQIDLFSYATMINSRIQAMDSELRVKAGQIATIGQVLPSLIPHLKPPELDGFKERHRMLVARAWSCPFCPNIDFVGEEELRAHLQNMHKAEYIPGSATPDPNPRPNPEIKTTPPTCPLCKKGELVRLPHGELKCTECRAIVRDDEVRDRNE